MIRIELHALSGERLQQQLRDPLMPIQDFWHCDYTTIQESMDLRLAVMLGLYYQADRF